MLPLGRPWRLFGSLLRFSWVTTGSLGVLGAPLPSTVGPKSGFCSTCAPPGLHFAPFRGLFGALKPSWWVLRDAFDTLVVVFASLFSPKWELKLVLSGVAVVHEM